MQVNCDVMHPVVNVRCAESVNRVGKTSLIFPLQVSLRDRKKVKRAKLIFFLNGKHILLVCFRYSKRIEILKIRID